MSLAAIARAGLAVMLMTFVLPAHAQAPSSPTVPSQGSAVAAPAHDWSKAKRVTIIMVDYKFIEDRLTLLRDVPYQLHVENKGTEIHDMTSPEFFKSL